MKSQFISSMAVTAAFTAFFCLAPKQSSAQIMPPYNINNNLPCPVDVSWSIYDANGAFCNSGGPSSISAAGVLTLSGANFAGCVLPASDIQVVLLTIHGTPISKPVAVDVVYTVEPIPPFSGCTGASPQLMWTNTDCFVNP